MKIPVDASESIKAAFRDVEHAIARWTGDQNIDLHGRKFLNVGAAVKGNEYVTEQQLEDAINGIQFDTPATPTVSTVYYGLHDDRTAMAPGTVPGSLFYETDRAALYQSELSSGADVWALVMCRPLRTATAKPSDLTTDDAGFTWFDQVEGITWRWSGGAWNYYLGSYVAAFASRPSDALADRGFLFVASDLGYQVWRKGSTTWVLMTGWGGPASGNLSGITGSLTANDVGFLYYAVDYDRTYYWNGASYNDAYGEAQRGEIAYFATAALPGAMWALCDGSTVTMSTGSGGTTSYVTPNLTGSNRFVRAVSGATGGTGGAASTTIAIDVPSTTSGNDSGAGTVVAAGVGTTVATHTHTHDTDPVSFTSPTIATEPQYLNLRPYVRL